MNSASIFHDRLWCWTLSHLLRALHTNLHSCPSHVLNITILLLHRGENTDNTAIQCQFFRLDTFNPQPGEAIGYQIGFFYTLCKQPPPPFLLGFTQSFCRLLETKVKFFLKIVTIFPSKLSFLCQLCIVRRPPKLYKSPT